MDAVFGAFSPEPGLFDPSERGAFVRNHSRIDTDDTALQGFGHAPDAPDRRCPNRDAVAAFAGVPRLSPWRKNSRDAARRVAGIGLDLAMRSEFGQPAAQLLIIVPIAS